LSLVYITDVAERSPRCNSHLLKCLKAYLILSLGILMLLLLKLSVVLDRHQQHQQHLNLISSGQFQHQSLHPPSTSRPLPPSANLSSLFSRPLRTPSGNNNNSNQQAVSSLTLNNNQQVDYSG
jgi:hypothetical protein